MLWRKFTGLAITPFCSDAIASGTSVPTANLRYISTIARWYQIRLIARNKNFSPSQTQVINITKKSVISQL